MATATITAGLAYLSGSVNSELAIDELAVTLGAAGMTRITQNIGTSEEALLLGDVSALGFLLAINRDATNFVELRVGTGGAKFCKLKPGEFCLLRLGAGAQVPFAIADSGACDLEFLLTKA